MTTFKPTAITDYVLNSPDYTTENLDFIKENLESELVLHEINEENETIKVSKYENGKTYNLPFYLFEKSNSEQEESEIVHKFTFKNIEKRHIVVGLIILSLGFILIKSTDFSSANIQNVKTGPIQAKTNIQILTENLNSNNTKKSEKLELRKKLSDQLKNLDSEINSINTENSVIVSNLTSLSN